jgi:crotonobetainyl-CoA:carnitine CoA-transferase CaiB-like acyl-CoA transferase
LEERKVALPLEGIRVLDLSQLLPGSLCTQILADLGADVLKIENTKGGDGFRWTPPLVKTLGSFFHVTNRNKRGMKLNLREPAGREIFLKLVPEADVLLDNFRPGGMRRMGLGYDDLKQINPRLIYCSLTGFGQDGPYRDRAAHDLNFLSISGILDLLGEKGGRPIVPAIQIAGAGGGSLNAALGILAALIRRERTGAGQYLDVAILDGLAPFLALTMSQYLADGQLTRRGESLVGGGYAFYNVYETADGKFLALGALEEKFWIEFCKAVGREDLIEEQFAPAPRQDELIEEVRAIIRQKTRQEWVDLLSQYDTCFSPVNNLEEALQDPQIQHRGLWFKGQHPVDGEIGQMAFPIKFSADQPGWRMPPPSYGEHTEEILKELGYSDEEIADLGARGII